MERIIKFRGKCINGSGWVYGDLVHNAFNGSSKTIEVGIQMKYMWPVEVIPETVGQFIGLKDKNGKDIYDGDTTKFNEFVIFENGSFKTTYTGDTQGGCLLTKMRCSKIIITGSIHDKL